MLSKCHHANQPTHCNVRWLFVFSVTIILFVAINIFMLKQQSFLLTKYFGAIMKDSKPKLKKNHFFFYLKTQSKFGEGNLQKIPKEISIVKQRKRIKEFSSKHRTIAAPIRYRYSLVIRANVNLGNRMFMYAAAFSLAKITKRNFVYRSTSELLYKSFGINRTEENINMKRLVTISEKKCCSYQKNLLQLQKGNVVIVGYLQSWKYFDKQKEEIRRIFTFKKNVNEEASSFISLIRSTVNNSHQIIGIHIRRGDMLRQSNTRHGHKVADESYLHRAMAYFERNGTPLFVVTSNDFNWSKSALKLYDNKVVFAEGNSAFLDMAILSKCDNLIITVGTFGWWAGYLSDGVVVYYKDWPVKGSVLDALLTIEDYFPPDWVGL